LVRWIISIVSLVIPSLVEGYAFAGVDTPKIIIDTIQTNPSAVHIGNYFTINETVRNISNETIDILNFGCKGPIRVLFDNSIEVKAKAIKSGICYNPTQMITLKASESAVLLGPNTEDYKEPSGGIVEAVLQLEY
jgi:hypothetical protein